MALRLTPAAEEMKEADWNFPKAGFRHVLGPWNKGGRRSYRPERSPEEIAFKLPEDARIHNWQQVLNTAAVADPPLRPGAETRRRRSVLAFAARHE
jgi:glycogen operon protein